MTFFGDLPTTISVEGTEIPINWSFRSSMEFEAAMQNTSLSPEEQIECMLSAYFDENSIPLLKKIIDKGNTEDLVSSVFLFYKCGKNERNISAQEKKSRPTYSFIFDAERIYAAFLEQYGLDLYLVNNLHWWKFRAMFSNLSDNCEFVRIMQIRGKEIDSKMNAKERRALRKAKALYALPDLRSEEQIEKDFADSFENMF